jgi:hypothetical protein
MNFASRKQQSLAETARYAADTGSMPPKPRQGLLRRVRWMLIPVGAVGALAAAGGAIYASRGSAAQQPTVLAARVEPAGALAAPASVTPASAAPAKRSSTSKKVEVARPKPELAADSTPWRDPVDVKPPAEPEPKPTPAPSRPPAEPPRPKMAEPPAPSAARLAEIEREAEARRLAAIEREAEERRLARLAKRKAERQARAAEAAAAERREKARAAEAAAEERREQARAAEAAAERREKARSRAVAERARGARRVETARSVQPAAPQPRVAEARPRRSGLRVGLLTPFGVIGLSGQSQSYSMYPGAPPPRFGGY